MEGKKEEILKEITIVDTEKEFIKNKVHNLMSPLGLNSVYSNSIVIEEKGTKADIKEDVSENSYIELKRETSNLRQYQLHDINSDIENINYAEHSSDLTSMVSYSEASDTERNLAKEEMSSYYDVKINVDPKVMYKEFVKVFLKVKFENLHSQHKGQNVQQTLVWKEALRRNIPKSQYEEFIIEELKNSSKYDRLKNKSKSPINK